MKEKQAVTRVYKTPYHKAEKKAKSTLLDECIRLTGYIRKSTVRLLSGKPAKSMLLSGNKLALKTTALILMYSLIAVMILNMTYIGALTPELPCSVMFG
ncbi:MAG: hypothetical protein LBC51_09685 [Treponema sp.]|nr:hypothetical protein [Treponema sp.]